MVKKLNKLFIQFMVVLISVLFLSNIFTNNVSALQQTAYPTNARIRWNTDSGSVYTDVNYLTNGPWIQYAPDNSYGSLVLYFYLKNNDNTTPFQIPADQTFTFSLSFSFRENNVFRHFASECPVGQPIRDVGSSAGLQADTIITDCNFSNSTVSVGTETLHYYTYFITARSIMAINDGQIALGWRLFDYVQSNNSNNQLYISRPIFNFVEHLDEGAAAVDAPQS